MISKQCAEGGPPQAQKGRLKSTAAAAFLTERSAGSAAGVFPVRLGSAAGLAQASPDHCPRASPGDWRGPRGPRVSLAVCPPVWLHTDTAGVEGQLLRRKDDTASESFFSLPFQRPGTKATLYNNWAALPHAGWKPQPAGPAQRPGWPPLSKSLFFGNLSSPDPPVAAAACHM